jgi:hypothetical protein
MSENSNQASEGFLGRPAVSSAILAKLHPCDATPKVAFYKYCSNDVLRLSLVYGHGLNA